MLKRAAVVASFVVIAAGLSMAGGAFGEDHGKQPWVVDIEDLTVGNVHFRATKWTGRDLQMTVMSIEPGGEIGLEKHDEGDQFIRVEKGKARVVMGASRDEMTFDRRVSDDWAILIPAGLWHNIINEGDEPLKVYVIYAPPEHPAGTVHRTREESEAAHGH
ncbi:MAG TPA: cupin domain-containing protein [Thermoanaerobaculia bacterium]|nr:cupin domain-containing protein [Thermoanaerobaculia bacterium]